MDEADNQRDAAELINLVKEQIRKWLQQDKLPSLISYSARTQVSNLSNRTPSVATNVDKVQQEKQEQSPTV